jgi:hypothetical protein
MPRIIEVTLQTIACSANGFGGAVQVSGDLGGETFQNDPNNPAESTGRKDISRSRMVRSASPWARPFR